MGWWQRSRSRRCDLEKRWSRQPLAATAWLVLAVFASVLTAATAASAQFGVGLRQEWTDFRDPVGRFTLRVPPGWTYQDDMSTNDFFVFYGPGTHDLFYLELLTPGSGTTNPAAQAQDALRRYSGPDGLRNFRVLSTPTPGSLSGKEASFIVYAYTDSDGSSMVEGRAFVDHGGQVLTLAFADEASRFDQQVPVFNDIMASLNLLEVPRIPAVGTGFGVGSSGPVLPSVPAISSTAETDEPGAAAGSPYYTSPGGSYRFVVPDGWELWEEQATSRGDTIEPWNGVVLWRGKPMTKTLFLWDYFDEWEQKGAQYEIVLAVVENVPGTLDDALATLKNNVMGEHARIYTTSTRRARIGGQTGVAADIVVREGMVEPWSVVSQWYRTVTFYTFKQGSTVFLWVVPKDVERHPSVVQAMESFQWLAR